MKGQGRIIAIVFSCCISWISYSQIPTQVVRGKVIDIEARTGLKGADIPNPNHFAFVGTSGGGFTIFSSQVLSNSDFYTSAFPPQFGNPGFAGQESAEPETCNWVCIQQLQSDYRNTDFTRDCTPLKLLG